MVAFVLLSTTGPSVSARPDLPDPDVRSTLMSVPAHPVTTMLPVLISLKDTSKLNKIQ